VSLLLIKINEIVAIRKEMFPNPRRAQYLQDIKEILNESFLLVQKSHQTTSSVFPLYVANVRLPPAVFITNNVPSIPSEEKERQEKKHTKIAAVVLGVGASFLGTFLVATDEYSQFCRLQLDEKMKVLATISQEVTDKKLNLFLETYEVWKKLFEQRTKPQRVAKVTGSAALVGMAGGFFIASSTLAMTGLIGATVSGCYLFWKYLTLTKSGEEQVFKNFQAQLEDLLDREVRIGLGEGCEGCSPVPSAPPP
jgi:hypothetical protein